MNKNPSNQLLKIKSWQWKNLMILSNKILASLKLSLKKITGKKLKDMQQPWKLKKELVKEKEIREKEIKISDGNSTTFKYFCNQKNGLAELPTVVEKYMGLDQSLFAIKSINIRSLFEMTFEFQFQSI